MKKSNPRDQLDTGLPKWLIAAFVISFSFTYIFLNQNYRPNDFDDSSYLANVYNYIHNGIEYGITFGDFVSTSQPSGVKYFEKTQALIMGHTLDLIGWSKTNAHLISLAFILASAWLWFLFLKTMGYSRSLSLGFALSLPIIEPFFSAATNSRSDAFVFLMGAASLLCLVKERYLLMALFFCAGLETHPTGVIISLYFLAIWLTRQDLRDRFLKSWVKNGSLIAFGLILGGIYYVALHEEALRAVGTVLANSNSRSSVNFQNFIFDYFFNTKYLRHLPELFIILTALAIYLAKKMYRQDKLTGALLLLLLLSSLIIQRPNFKYIIYVYPGFLLLILVVSEQLGKIRLTLIGVLFIFLPQYVAAYYVNRSFSFNNEMTALKTSVPSDSLPVVGTTNAWYAFYKREFYYNTYMGDFGKLGLKKFYLIEDPDYLKSTCQTKTIIQENYQEENIQTLVINGQTVSIKKEILRSVSK